MATRQTKTSTTLKQIQTMKPSISRGMKLKTLAKSSKTDKTPIRTSHTKASTSKKVKKAVG